MTSGVIENTQIVGLPDGYTSRPPTVEDADAVTEMLNAYAVKLVGAVEHRAAHLRHEWQMPSWDKDKYARIVFAPDGSVAAFGDFYNESAPHVRPGFWVRVHPDHWRRGIGTAFVKWAEGIAMSELDRAPSDAQVKLGCGMPAQDIGGYALLTSLGFEEVRRFWRMVIDFNGQPPEPEWADGITVRAIETRDDEREAYKVVRAAFKDHWGYVDGPFEESWNRLQEMLFNDDYDASCRFLAMDGDQIVGVSLNSNIATADESLAWIGTLGVIREYRGKGIAKALLNHSFREFYARGKSGVGLGVDASSLTGATKLYESVGMHVAREFVSFAKELRGGVDLSTTSVQ